jgi:hypothetical protein
MPSTALTKARADLAAARKRASSYRREARSSQGAIMPAATVLAGSIANTVEDQLQTARQGAAANA